MSVRHRSWIRQLVFLNCCLTVMIAVPIGFVMVDEVCRIRGGFYFGTEWLFLAVLIVTVNFLCWKALERVTK